MEDEYKESRYKIYRLPNGFVVEGKDRISQKITVEDGWQISVANADGSAEWRGTQRGLLDYKQVLIDIATGLFYEYTPPEKPEKDRRVHHWIVDTFEYEPKWQVNEWVKDNFVKKVGGRLGVEIKRLWTLVPEENLAYQRAFWSSLRGVPYILRKKKHWDLVPEKLRRDILQYHALRLIMQSITYLDGDDVQSSSFFLEDAKYTLENFLRNNWRGFLSPDGKPYKSLNITLDELHKQVPISPLFHLNRIKLRQPIYKSKLAFAFLEAVHDKTYYRGDDQLAYYEPYNTWAGKFLSDEESLKEALYLLKGGEKIPRKYNEMRSWFGDLLDGGVAGEHYNPAGLKQITSFNSLTALARASREYHLNPPEINYMYYTTGITENSLLALPSIMPKIKGVRVLETAGDMVNEGDHMHHCVGGYTYKGIVGDSFFLHIDHAGEEATVEVGIDQDRLYIVQSRGVCNASNKASKWAYRALDKWLNSGVTPIIRESDDIVNRLGGRRKNNVVHIQWEPANNMGHVNNIFIGEEGEIPF